MRNLVNDNVGKRFKTVNHLKTRCLRFQIYGLTKIKKKNYYILQHKLKVNYYFLAPDFHKRDITNLDIAAQCIVFFFGGFETVTTTMSFMAYELGVNPDIQNRLRDEIEKTNKECNGKLTYEALMRMKYMDMVLSGKLFFYIVKFIYYHTLLALSLLITFYIASYLWIFYTI